VEFDLQIEAIDYYGGMLRNLSATSRRHNGSAANNVRRNITWLILQE
jgi:hypothetical protein